MSTHRSVLILSALGAFLVAAVAPQVSSAVTITNHFDVDPLWTGVNNTAPSNNYGYSATTSVAGGSPGEVGGTFARRTAEDYYADTVMGGLNGGYFTLGHALEGSGKFDLNHVTNMNNVVLIGHRSASIADKSFLGLVIAESQPASFRVGAAWSLSDGTVTFSSLSTLSQDSDSYFTYSYNPTGGANSQGQLSVTVTNSTFANTFILDLTAANRATGGKFDAWGLGSLPANDTAEHGDVFIDDVIYTAVPEPTTLAMLGLGGMMILWRRRAH